MMREVKEHTGEGQVKIILVHSTTDLFAIAHEAKESVFDRIVVLTIRVDDKGTSSGRDDHAKQ
jgi:hypothetical protein